MQPLRLPKKNYDDTDGLKDHVGKFKMGIYGERGAAMKRQEKVAKGMIRWGFKRGKYNPYLQ